jgi:hypothetical protein
MDQLGMTDFEWRAAEAEHERALGALADVLRRVPVDAWQESPAPGKWSAAEVALHVCQSYEFARDAVTKGVTQRMRVTRLMAVLLRTFVLPWSTRRGRLPRARSPREVRPDAEAARALDSAAALARLKQSAADAIVALKEADATNASARVVHAYFGAMRPRQAVGMLATHTRHHAGAVAEQYSRRGQLLRRAFTHSSTPGADPPAPPASPAPTSQ